jgi:hypothetical protein
MKTKRLRFLILIKHNSKVLYGIRVFCALALEGFLYDSCLAFLNFKNAPFDGVGYLEVITLSGMRTKRGCAAYDEVCDVDCSFLTNAVYPINS